MRQTVVLEHMVNSQNFIDDLEEGDIYRGKVDRISGGGNGIIELKKQHINLGPIREDAVGEVVKFKYLGDTVARCLSDKYLIEGYKPINQRSGSRKRLSDPSNKNKLLKGHL